MISILRIGSLRSPPPIRLRRTSPYAGGRIGHSMLSCRDMAPWLSTHSAPACGERWWRQPPKGECISNARQGGCMVFAAKGGIKNGAEGAVPPQWNGTSYLPRAEPSTRPGGVSRSRTEPLAPRAKGPAAPSTLTPAKAGVNLREYWEAPPRSRPRHRRLYRESLVLPREELDTTYTARHTGPSVSGPFPW